MVVLAGSVSKTLAPALVLGYGLPTVRELREAVAVIADACIAARGA